MHELKSGTKIDRSGAPRASLLHSMVKLALPYTITSMLCQLFPKVEATSSHGRADARVVNLHEKTSYVVPVTPSGLPEQFSSIEAHDVLVAPVAEAVTVAVATAEAVARAKRSSAVFALLASTPVPAARPTTAANNRAMMAHKMVTKTPQPQSPPFRLSPDADEPTPAAGVEWYGRGETWSSWLALWVE